MPELPSGLPALMRQTGHKSMNLAVYSHPRLGLSAALSWGVFEGSDSVRTYQQVKYARDTSLADWNDALNVLERCIEAARRQLALLDTGD